MFELLKAYCLHLLFLILFLSLNSCKTKHIDSEPKFQVKFFQYNKWKEKSYCFDRIYNTEGKNVDAGCVDSINYTIDFPLDLEKNTSTYFFKNKKQFDSLSVNYSLSTVIDDNQFKAVLINFDIQQTTFDSLYIQYPEKTGLGNSNEIYRINIFL